VGNGGNVNRVLEKIKLLIGGAKFRQGNEKNIEFMGVGMMDGQSGRRYKPRRKENRKGDQGG